MLRPVQIKEEVGELPDAKKPHFQATPQFVGCIIQLVGWEKPVNVEHSDNARSEVCTHTPPSSFLLSLDCTVVKQECIRTVTA